MDIRACAVGAFQTNCYMLTQGDTCILVDPGASFSKIQRMLEGRQPQYVLLTHHHGDHIGAMDDLRQAYDFEVVAHPLDAAVLAQPQADSDLLGLSQVLVNVERKVQDGEELQLGSITLQVIHTPGHTPGGLCFYSPEEKLLLAGDTLFYASYGRTDFEGGNMMDMHNSLSRLAQLPSDTVVLPGHGRDTTIGAEITRGILR